MCQISDPHFGLEMSRNIIPKQIQIYALYSHNLAKIRSETLHLQNQILNILKIF